MVIIQWYCDAIKYDCRISTHILVVFSVSMTVVVINNNFDSKDDDNNKQ